MKTFLPVKNGGTPLSRGIQRGHATRFLQSKHGSSKQALISLTLLLAFIMGVSGYGWGQTNPTAQSLPYSQDFSSLAWTSTSYPSGWNGWTISTTPGSSFNTATPTADRTLTASSTAATNSGNVHNYNGKIGYLNSSSLDLTIVLAITTSGKTSIGVAYDIMTIRNPYDGTSNTRINEVTLQYRVGTSGTFTNLTGIEYQNNTTTQTTAVTTPQNPQTMNITLPVACENQSIVQLRWASRQVSGAGSRPSFAVDNIFVTGISPSASITLSPAIQNFGPFCNSITNSVALTYTTSGTVTSPFVELSNSSGSFSTGTANLGGIVTGGPDYTITADIPSAQTASTLYRLRIKSTDAVPIVSLDNGSNIPINDPVTPSVTINDPGNVCSTQSVTFTPVPLNLGGGTASFSWTINGVPDVASGNTYTQSIWETGNSVQAVMTVTGGCVTSTSASSNTVTPTVSAATPSVSIAITAGTNPTCDGSSVTFTATTDELGGGTVSYQWKLNDENAGTDSPTYTLTPDNNDEIYCVINVTDGCVTSNTASSSTITMTVNTIPSTPIVTSDSPVCVGSTLNLTSDATGTIAWTGPNSFTSDEQNPSITSVTTAAAGIYSVTSTVDGCASEAGTTTVIINTLPAITTHPSSASIYEGENHTFTVVATGTGLTYKWFENTIEIPSATSSSYTVTVATLAMSGYSYTCEVSGTCAPPVTSNPAILTVTPQPFAKWTFEGITVSAAAGTSPVLTAGTYLADFGTQTTGSSFTGYHANSATVWSTPAGNGSVKALSANNWSVNDYFQFQVNTSGYFSISIKFDQTGSATGPRDFKFQYGTDGTNYNDFATYSVPNNAGVAIGWSTGLNHPESTLSFDLSSIITLNNKGAVYFRMVDNSTTAINGTTVAAAGTGRIDNFSVFGMSCTAPSSPAAGNIETTYDGSLHTGSATPPEGSSVAWYDAATEGNLLTEPPSRTDFGTSTAWAESVEDLTGCTSVARTEVTVTITKAPLTIAGTFTANNKVYDGSSDATINDNSLTLVTPVTGDDVSLTSIEPDFANGSVGTGKTVSITSASLTGSDAGNYTLSLAGASTATADINPVTLSLKVMLQGPYDTGTGFLKTDLYTAGNIPTGQPYGVAPWNYTGGETATSSSTSVDWILVELRSDVSTMIARFAGLLNNDGTIGITISDADYPDIHAGSNYYIVVWHRNHLPVMSIGAQTMPVSSYDLTQLSNLYGTNPAIDMGGSVYGMIAGDVTKNGRLQYSGAGNDRGPIIAKIMSEPGGTGVGLYKTVTDDYWFENTNMDNILRYLGDDNDRGIILANLNALVSPSLNSVYSSAVPGATGGKDTWKNDGPFDIQLSEFGQPLAINLITNETIENGLVDNIQFTLAWKADDTEIAEMLSSFTSDFMIAPQGEAYPINGLMHQVYVSVTPVDLPVEFNEGDQVTVMSFDNSTGQTVTGRLWIADDDFTAENNSMYYVSVWGSDFTGMIQSIATGLNEIPAAGSVSIYPNPVVNGMVNIAINLEGSQEVTITLTDMQGKMISYEEINLGRGLSIHAYDLKGVGKGVYFIRISGDNLNIIEKLVIQSIKL